jgi:hypothetical protein
MAELRSEERGLQLKVVYCGTPAAGKTTNVVHVRSAMDPSGPPLESPEEKEEGAVYRVLLPEIPLPVEPPLRLSIEVATVRGQASNLGHWHDLMRHADGVVFVADARRERLRDNLVAWADYLEYLRAVKRELDEVATVIQYNKLDLDTCMATGDLEAAINPESHPSFEAAAAHGRGVGKSFCEIVRRIVARVHADLDLENAGYRRSVFASAVDEALHQIGMRAGRRMREQEGTAPEAPTTPPESPSASLPPAPPPPPPVPSTPPVELAAGEQARAEPGDPEERGDLWATWYREGVRARGAVCKDREAARLRVADFAENARRPLDFLHKLVRHFEDSVPELPAATSEALEAGRRVVEYLAQITRFLVREEENALLLGRGVGDPARALETVIPRLREWLGKDFVEVDHGPLPALAAAPGDLEVIFHGLLLDAMQAVDRKAGSPALVLSAKETSRSVIVTLQGAFALDRLPAPGDRSLAWPHLALVRELLAVHGAALRVRPLPGRLSIVALRFRPALPLVSPSAPTEGSRSTVSAR